MTRAGPIPGISHHAQQVAWFEAWLRAVRSGVPGSAEVAVGELERLGVSVAVVSTGPKP